MFHQKVLLILLLSSISVVSESQITIKDHSNEKTVNHTLDVDPISIGYSITQRIHTKGHFGFGLHLGPSLRFFLNNPFYLRKSLVSDTVSLILYESVKLKPVVKSTFEIAQIKFFYRYFLWNDCYINLGVYLGGGFLIGEENSKLHFSAGALCEFFGGFKHWKLGTRLQIGNTHITYNSEYKTNFLSILVTPIIFQYCF
jgi:hypothetical protein